MEDNHVERPHFRARCVLQIHQPGPGRKALCLQADALECQREGCRHFTERNAYPLTAAPILAAPNRSTHRQIRSDIVTASKALPAQQTVPARNTMSNARQLKWVASCR